MSAQRDHIRNIVDEAVDAGARLKQACDIIGISTRTFQRWKQVKHNSDGRLIAHHIPPNKLSGEEEQAILHIVNTPKYANISPNQIVPLLADEGIYMGSESTFYRVLRSHNLIRHRQKSRVTRSRSKPKALTASKPNQVYSWDISYLPTTIRGVYLFLYLVLDVYSRKIVGWQIHHSEDSGHASNLMIDICRREGVNRHQVTLHSDNGSPMKGSTLLATLQSLGVVPSYSRPSVSNDNPYSESLFRTIKYCHQYPELAFRDMSHGRSWMSEFTSWYNDEHLHSGIKYVTPSQRHSGEDVSILAKRKEVYQLAKKRHPNRWSGQTRDWSVISTVHLNPEKTKGQKVA